MEEKAIREGFSQLRPGTEYDNLYSSALCRQQADWLVGINGTRLFTVLYRSKVLKVGRVQTPTLAMIVNRESEIMNFKKEPYYSVELQMGNLVATSEKFKEREEAQALMNKCCDEVFVSSLESVEKAKKPPALYDLNTLQIDANRWFGYTAKKTLELAQSLYEKKLMTYPRTDSKYLTEDMESTAKELVQLIISKYDFVSPFERELKPEVKAILNSKKVTDHHAIIPTMEIAKNTEITEEERNILELVACRMLCATGDKHVYISDTAVINCNDVEFKLSGTHIKDNGWKAFEDTKNRSAVLSAYTEPNTSIIRTLIYEYHRLGLDEMVLSPDKGRAKISSTLDYLKKIYDVAPMSVGLSMFKDAKLDELVNLYTKSSQTERDNAYEILSSLYPTENDRLNKIKAGTNK